MRTAVRATQQTIALPYISWKTYESFRQDYAGYSGVRLTYDRGILEIMSPGPEHEEVNRTLATLTETIAVEQDRDIAPYGSTTFRRPDLEIDDTSSSLDKLPLYARLGVREVWRYANGAVRIYGLVGSEYQIRDTSFAFPTLTAAILNELLAESRTLRRPEWICRVRAWANQTIAPTSQSDSEMPSSNP